jgi:hypothetical protein
MVPLVRVSASYVKDEPQFGWSVRNSSSIGNLLSRCLVDITKRKLMEEELKDSEKVSASMIMPVMSFGNST